MKWNMRVMLLGLVALGLAGLLRCTTAESPISPVSPVVRGLSFDLAEVPDDRITELVPDWSASPLEPGDTAIFECELRPGGGGAAVDSRRLSLEYGQEYELCWEEVSMLGPGWWEVFCRPLARGRAMVELIGTESQDCSHGCGFVFVEHWEQ